MQTEQVKKCFRKDGKSQDKQCVKNEIKQEFATQRVKQNVFGLRGAGEPLEEVMTYTKKNLSQL